MLIPHTFNTEKNKPQKKLVSFRNYDIIDNLIKDTAAYNNSSESLTIEQILQDSFFKDADPNVIYYITRYLWNPHGLAQTCSSIFKFYASQPQYAPPELLELLRFCRECEQRHMSHPLINESSKESLILCLQNIIAFINSKLKPGDSYVSPDSDYETFYGLSSLQEVLEELTHDTDQSDFYISIIFSQIYEYWFVGTDPVQEDDSGLQNNKWTYYLLSQLCNIVDWPDIPAYRHQLLQIARTIKPTKLQQKIASDTPNTTTIPIFLSHKSIKVSPQTIILQDNKDSLTRVKEKGIYTMPEYTEACILTPYGVHTDVPVIFLFNGDLNIAELNAINLVKDHFQFLFPTIRNYKELCLIQILFDGRYTDSRVKWLTT